MRFRNPPVVEAWIGFRLDLSEETTKWDEDTAAYFIKTHFDDFEIEPFPPVPAIVLDNFCGSGTTGEVCRETGRRFVGLDLSTRYLRDFALVRAERKQTAASIEAMPLFSLERQEHK